MSKEKILSLTKKDFDVQTFRCGGPGGQKQNKTSSGVRIVHKNSNATGESRESRSQKINQKIAFQRLSETKKFKDWIKLEVCRVSGELDKIKEHVEQQMNPENIKVEIMGDSGKWVEHNN